MNFNLNKKKAALALALAAAAAGAAFAAEPAPPASRARWVMGTLCQLDVWTPAPGPALAAAFDEIDRWDRVLSSYKKESELNALNASAGTGPFRASPELFAATAAALRLAEASGGAFDPTVAPVISRGPAALPLVGWSKVRLDPRARTIELPIKGMALDFGGIGKGWALDRAADALRARGVARAFFNFGGQILAVGASPEGGDWTVALPGRAEPLKIRDASVSTSGDAERPGHIVSPFDGKPVRRKTTATAVLPSATEADAWSTALYVLGNTPPGFPGRSYFATVPESPATGALK